MLSTRFKTGIVGSNEVYIFQKAGHEQLSTQTIPFPNSLITFLYMDMATAAPLLRKAADALNILIQTYDTEYARKTLFALNSLAKLHIYFEFLLQDWQDGISTAQELNSYTEQLLNPSLLRHIPENMRFIQKQIGCLFARVLDKDSENTPISARMAAYCGESGALVFQFVPLAIRFELLGNQGFTNVLYPKSIYDLIDYQLRECINRGIKLRICKNCGHYFPVRGRGTALYCDITTDQTGRTCKNVGAFVSWTNKNADTEPFATYRQEYKRRFAWIKSGRIKPEEFYAWSKISREKRADCETGTISLEEFTAWLKES